MRASMMIGAAAVALALAACNNHTQTPPSAATPEEKAAVPDANPSATVIGATNVTVAPNFVTKAASSDLFEIASSKIALKRSNNPDVKRFARMMIEAHTKSTAGLREAITASGQTLSLPTDLPDDLQGKINDLNKIDDAHFDQTYMGDQVDGHQAALNLIQRYAQDGDVAGLKDFAAKTAPTVQEHLTAAKTLRDGLKKPAA